MHKEELIKFRKLSASGSRNFLKDSSALRDRAFFHDLADISGERVIEFSFKNVSQMYPWTRKTPLNFGSNPDPESGSGVSIRIWTADPETIFSLADVCGL